MTYSAAIMARFMQPTYAKPLVPSALARMYQATAGAQDQGVVLTLCVQIDQQSQQISAASFQVYGCGACIATADLLCEMLIGLNLKELLSFNVPSLALALDLPAVKMHCTWLATEVLEKIISAWQLATATH